MTRCHCAYASEAQRTLADGQLVILSGRSKRLLARPARKDHIARGHTQGLVGASGQSAVTSETEGACGHSQVQIACCCPQLRGVLETDPTRNHIQAGILTRDNLGQPTGTDAVLTFKHKRLRRPNHCALRQRAQALINLDADIAPRCQSACTAGAPISITQFQSQIIASTQSAGVGEGRMTLRHINAQVTRLGLQGAGPHHSQLPCPKNRQIEIATGNEGGCTLQAHITPCEGQRDIACFGTDRGGVVGAQTGLQTRYADADTVALQHSGTPPGHSAVRQRGTQNPAAGAQRGARACGGGPLALGQRNAEASGRRDAGGTCKGQVAAVGAGNGHGTGSGRDRGCATGI